MWDRDREREILTLCFMDNPGEVMDRMLSSFQIDVSEHNLTVPLVRPWEASIHPWGSSVYVISQSVYMCVYQLTKNSCSIDIYMYPCLPCTNTHIPAHSHNTPSHHIKKSSVSTTIFNFCFKCSSIKECQVSSVTQHTHAICVHHLLLSVFVCMCVCECKERWVKHYLCIE